MQSESIKELATALAKAQGQMKPATKSADNPYFKSKVVNRHIKRVENNTRLNNKNVIEVANGLQKERISKH